MAVLFKEFVAQKHYSFHEGFDDWREAIRAACAPLVADGTIQKEYVSYIIEKVEELGPYIVIAPEICIPHEDGEHDARIFVVLAAADDEEHIQNLMELSERLSDEETVAKLLAATTPEDLFAIEE